LKISILKAKFKKLFTNPKKFFYDSHLLNKTSNFKEKNVIHNIDATFSKEMRSIADNFDARFSNNELYFLQNESKDKDFTAKINKIHECNKNKLKNKNYAITLVVLAHDNNYNLSRALSIIARQYQKDLQIIIIGETYKVEHDDFFKNKAINVIYLSITNKINAQNVHVLATYYAKGKYLTFIRSTDVIRASYCEKLISLAQQHDADMVLCKYVENGDILHTRNIEYATHIIKNLDFDEKNSTKYIECTLNHIYGKLFITQKFKNIISKNYSKELSGWLQLLHLVEYLHTYCDTIAITEEPLLKETPSELNYVSYSNFCYALKNGFVEVSQYLQDNLPKNLYNHIINNAIFYEIPRTLSKFANVPYDATKLGIIFSHIAFYLANCRTILQQDEMDELLLIYFEALYYGRWMASRKVHSIHTYFLKKQKIKPNGVCLHDTEGMEDLKIHLLPAIDKKYKVTHIKKGAFILYTQLENLVFSVICSRSTLVITSNWMHKYASAGKQVLHLWHGYGLMKKPIPPNNKKDYPSHYAVVSSESCREEYAKMFNISAENTFAYGSIQTDAYFNHKKTNQAYKIAYKEFPDLINKKICFFAPTFRRFSLDVMPTYYSNWNFDEIDKALSAKNTVIVYKLHHTLKNLFNNKGILNYDLRDSSKMCLRETSIEDIFNWICACDVFISDYSSAMFLALLLDKPLVFYTPDLDEYLTSGNGTLIDYKNDVPGPIVKSNSIEELMEAIEIAPTFVDTAKYKQFKEKQMGACDGNVIKRIKNLIEDMSKNNEIRAQHYTKELS
jgi:CDP-ribitol ribitolphosphotransferase